MHKKLTETLTSYTKIILVGGGTGGHIQPIVSLVHSLDDEVSRYLWIGGANSQEEKTAKIENIEFQSIPTLKLSTTKSLKSILYPIYVLVGVLSARILLKKIIHSDHNIALFSKGGPGSVAIGLAAWSLRIPLYIHESDTIPGRSNRILGKIATGIFLGFDNATTYFDSRKCDVVGQILDPIFSQELIDSPRGPIVWNTTKPHILVICGSQGSRTIFASIIEQFSKTEEYEWIIALGKLNSTMRLDFAQLPHSQALDWISQENIASLISHAQIAITRGSATTLAELTAFNQRKPHLIMVPIPFSASNHQYYNCLEYEKSGHTLLNQHALSELTNILMYQINHDTYGAKNQ